MLSVTECSHKFQRTRPAIYYIIKKNRVKVTKTKTKTKTKWMIDPQDLETYLKERWDRKFSKIDGNLVFDESKGEISVRKASEILGCDMNHTYHACKRGLIPTTKKKCSWVIKIEDVLEYKTKMKLGKKRER